jgi:hypothetical protein
MAIDNFFKDIGGKLVANKFKGDDNKDRSGGDPLKKFTDENKPENEAFFAPKKIEPERATRIYPYRLLVIDIRDNKIIKGSAPDSFYFNYNEETGGTNFVQQNYNQWEFVLPITPQQLSITDQFAINTTATMRGVVEEHNGVKFKIIQASGTTGIFPIRNSFQDPDSGRGQTLFGGTAEALGGLIDAANALSGTKPKPTVGANSKDPKKNKNTGYYQAMLLQQFLEQYAIAKKKPKNKHWRLVFDCPKMNESFIVTPMQYTVTKSQRSPGEHLFNMQFKAWKRVDLEAKTTPRSKEIQGLTLDFFKN